MIDLKTFSNSPDATLIAKRQAGKNTVSVIYVLYFRLDGVKILETFKAFLTERRSDIFSNA